MTFTKRDKTWTMVAPGLWTDPSGESHWFPDEVAAELGVPYTRENYDAIMEAIREMTVMLGRDDLEIVQLQHERKPDA